MNGTNDSETLYRACVQDGSDAQIDAFTTLWGQVYRITYGMLHSYPDGAALAADCAQTALIKIHRNLAQCNDPQTFRAWAAQIARRSVLDLVRQAAARRTARLDDHETPPPALQVAPPDDADDLHTLLLRVIQHGPLSDRSQRVVLGRFFDEQSDDALALAESERSGQSILPSHIQVTRSKNLSKLRADPLLLAHLRTLVEV